MSNELKIKKRIFFADDEKAWTDVMTALFALRGYTQTIACNDATKVIQEAQNYQPDILLVDLRWDKGSSGDPQILQGDHILNEIKNRKLFPTAFVIALTQELSTTDKAVFDGKWEGFNLILKSSSSDQLIADLHNLGAL